MQKQYNESNSGTLLENNVNGSSVLLLVGLNQHKE